jgi:hypothetical protein
MYAFISSLLSRGGRYFTSGRILPKEKSGHFLSLCHLQTIQWTNAFDADMEINFSRFTVEVWTLTIGLLMVIERKVHRK